MSHLHHSVILATCGRAKLLERALRSVGSQTLQPARIVLVEDQDAPDLAGLQRLGRSLGLTVEVLKNRRTRGASGAWNTALDHLVRTDPEPASHIVSILDDDDWWDARYLQHVHQVALSGADVMAATIARHDNSTPGGRLCSPPARLRIADFLTGNPGIQGSNLSARLSTLLMAGLFDEALASCTDRDLCIRLAQLRPTYAPVSEAVAHHDTLHALPRLSDSGEPGKLKGLDAFHAKWRPCMSDEQYEAFAERAQRFFGWSPPTLSVAAEPDSSSAIRTASTAEPIQLVIGIIVDGSRPERCRPLLDGLRKLSQHRSVHSIEVVLLENGDAAGFHEVLEHGRTIGLNLWPIDLNDQQAAAPALALVDEDISRQKPIATARTLLQRFVYEVSHARNYAPAWILDDDFRLPESLDELVDALIACRDSGIDVALGGNSGAAPVPASSLLRTQLVDIVHFLNWAMAHDPNEHMPDADAANGLWLRGHRDYYYDLTRAGTDRLETPFLPHLESSRLGPATAEILRRAERLLAGEAISRPVLPAPACCPTQAPESCLRGGNSLILDPILLRDIPNMAPRIAGRPTRRSDMIWAANAQYRRGKSVKSVRLPMAHDRSMERVDEDDTQRLVDDVVGYGFFRAYEEILSGRHRGTSAPFSEDEQHRILRATRKYARERLAAYRLSFWRARGLARVLRNLIDECPWWLVQAPRGDRAAFDRFLTLLDRTAGLKHLRRVENGVEAGLRTGDFLGFLSEMESLHPERPAAEAPSLRSWIEDQREAHARRLLERNLRTPGGARLGIGAEGVVLRVADRVVKVFDSWTREQRHKAAPVVAALRDNPTDGALPCVVAVHDWCEALAVEYRFEPSEPYSGGHGAKMLAMLQDLRSHGWVHSNISPKNLRLTASGLQLIDIGKSLEFATTPAEEMMIRRAFLAWRFAGRDDLANVMRASLSSELQPELTGWQVLKDALQLAPSKQRLDRHIRELAESLEPRTLLDYGCGKPREAARWADSRQFTAFDPDRNLAERWLRDAPGIPFWNRAMLETALRQGKHFDLIVCSLVLCAVEDPSMAAILSDLRRLAGEAGRVLVAVCDPAAVHVEHTLDQRRDGTTGLDAHLPARYSKNITGSASSRVEFHRSVDAYRRAFARAGLRIIEQSTISGFDAARFERIPEFLIFELVPLPGLAVQTSLLIKLCALEAETALYQVRHLERQLARPRAFDEVVLLLDSHEGPFPRAHCAGSLTELRKAADRLIAEGVVDRVITGLRDGAAAADWAQRWAGVAAHRAHCVNGQPATAILAALEQCAGEYILHADADVLVARPDPAFDHIHETARVFAQNPDAVTLALAVKGDADPSPRRRSPNGRSFRTEATTGWIAKSRLQALRPLPGSATAGQLNQPWHRMLDLAIGQSNASSLRRGSTGLWFAAPDNARKGNVDEHLLFMDRVEADFAPPLQEGEPLVQGALTTWLGPKRTEPVVVIICGRNVRPGAIDRCMTSLRMQTYRDWGAIVIDDASDNGADEMLARACRPWSERITLLRRRRRVGLLANIFLAVREFVAPPETVVVLLDLDDALADPGVLALVAERHRNGADLTVGSMLRTDKAATYPVDFSNPRGNRGGNVWQHLRTFRKSLFDRVAPEDLKLDREWIDLATDWAFMLPITEMAKRPVWIRSALYLHEPSTERPPEEKAAREAVISRIVAKPSYRNRRPSPPRLTVLCYHRILEALPASGPDALFHQRGVVVSAATLRAQLQAALRHFEPIRAADLLAALHGERTLPERPLLVTCDDGYRDFMTTALPVMSQVGIEPILFARTPGADGYPSWAPLDLVYMSRGLAGLTTPLSSLEWREHLLRLPLHQQMVEIRNHIRRTAATDLDEARRALYLSHQDLQGLRGVALASHGVEHIRWTNLSSDELDNTLRRGLRWLEGIGGVPLAAYPDGAHDKRVAGRLAACGYFAGFTLSSSAEDVPPPFAVRRILMPNDIGYVARLIRDSQENAA